MRIVYAATSARSCLPRVLLAGHHHAWLQQRVLENYSVSMQRVKHFVQNGLGDLGTAVDAVIAVDQDLGLNDRHDAMLLADRGIAGKRFGVGLDRKPTRKRVGHVVDGAPFREACALLLVTIKALRQSVQPLGDFVTGCVGQWNLAGIDLDPRHDALACRQLR